MLKDKKSFFERLTGAVKVDDTQRGVQDEKENEKGEWMEEEAEEGQLAVDVHQTPEEIVIKTMVAGVRPEDLDVNITRDMVTIKGKREGERGISDENYFSKELYWGSFSRTILLPQEVEPEESEAIEKHGLLIIKLPKINKGKQTKLKVKTI
ncbi:MAG: Hsp20/alpha crystallin family protein [Candidatus Pacebacteria bacterium]|nr:Hsp20/alpha crystallin family protein [Candidatus Paceibacterota bacterium]MDD5357451.1 Hsp20/alpha crystallin family protein [Candidatus Paceibacterota bacterium]